MGFAPIKWTCTAFFRPRQLTDRAILANRQTQEKKDNQKYRRFTSIGRTAQIHDFHMLHFAAWPTGVKAWTRILGLINLPDLPAAHPDKILTQAGVLAATGKKLPAHLRDAYPGFELGLRLILDCLLPVQLRTYLTNVLSLILTEDSGWLMASADPSIRDANRELHIIGHSAGSFTAMVLSDILQDPKFGPFFGCTRATAIAMPSRLFETHYTQRTIHLYHVLEDELCVWRPTKEDLALLNDHGIEVTLISGNALWMGNETTAMDTLFSLALGQVRIRLPRSSMSQAWFRCLKNKKPHCASCHGAPIVCRTRPNTCYRP